MDVCATRGLSFFFHHLFFFCFCLVFFRGYRDDVRDIPAGALSGFPRHESGFDCGHIFAGSAHLPTQERLRRVRRGVGIVLRRPFPSFFRYPPRLQVTRRTRTASALFAIGWHDDDVIS